MSANNNYQQHYKTIAKTCYTANILYLILHVFYLVLFIITKANILVYVDIGVIVFYLASFFTIYKKQYYLYALLCGNLFFFFVSITTIMLGFASGFHLLLIGLCVVSFFTSYFSKRKDIKGSIFWTFLSLVIYLILFFITENREPRYIIDKWLEMTLFTTHAVVVFALVASYLVVFLKYALSLEKKIMNESRTDELTQINNRYGLYDYFVGNKDMSSKLLALFDIDDFKNINDRYGHVTGDYVLKQVAEITSNIFKDEFVCRFGGEEFVIVSDDTERKPAKDKLEELIKTIEKQTFEFEGVKINITITIGGVHYPKDITLEKWVELADEKMYEGKKSGKNKIVI